MSHLFVSPFEIRLGDGGIIRGEVRAAKKPGDRPALFLAHGFKGFKDWAFMPYAAEKLAEAGFVAITFNFSRNGVGERDFDELSKFGYNTYTREQADLQEVLKAAIGGNLPHSSLIQRAKLGVIGHSRGGGNALIFAAEHPLIRAAATWNGIARANLFDDAFEAKAREEGVAYVANSRTQQEMPVRREFFEDLDANKDRFDIPARLAGLRIPVLMIQGSDDAPRLVEGFRRLQEAAPRQQALELEGTGHTFGAVHPFAGTTEALEQALDATIGFFKTNL